MQITLNTNQGEMTFETNDMFKDVQNWLAKWADGSSTPIKYTYIRLNKDYQLSPRGSVDFLSGAYFDTWDISSKVDLNNNKLIYNQILEILS